MKNAWKLSGLFTALTALPAAAQDAAVIGKPTPGGTGFQVAATELARDLQSLDWLILVIITVICIFVTALILWVAFRYANDIFTLGQEMQDVFAGRLERAPEKLTVGVSDLIPKLILHRLLEPALSHESAPRIVCREDKTERLLAELSIHDLDIVLAEAPIARQASVRAFNHLLGESDVSFFAKAPMARRYRSGFPDSLDGAPLLLPTENTLLRRDLDHWFQDEDIHPRIVAEFEDSALLKAFGSEGVGIFPGPAAIEDEICDRYRVRPVGRTHRVVERFYAITVERRITHPAARLISEAAKTRLFPT